MVITQPTFGIKLTSDATLSTAKLRQKKNKPTDRVTSKNNTNEIIIKRKSTYQDKILGWDYPNSCAKVSQRKGARL